MDRCVQLSYWYHDTDVVELKVSAWNGTFAGSTRLYVGQGDLADTAILLTGFPVGLKDRREVTFGAFGPKSAGGAMNLKFSCIDGAGHCQLHLMVEADYDRRDAAERVEMLCGTFGKLDRNFRNADDTATTLISVPRTTSPTSMVAKRKRMIISIGALGTALIVLGALALIHVGTRVSVRTYRMEVAFDGKAPWGDVGPEVEGEGSPTVLYRRVGNSYCYTAFKSEQLTALLRREDAKQATVQYNVFGTFGRERKYTLRSIDGVLLTDAKGTLKQVNEFGGQILLGSNEALSCP